MIQFGVEFHIEHTNLSDVDGMQYFSELYLRTFSEPLGKWTLGSS